MALPATRRPEVTWATNAVGTRRLLDAVVTARVPALVCVTSIAAYSPAGHDDPVDECWPTDGTSAAAYCREKAYVERSRPDLRVVRLRPAFVFQRSSASEQRRIFGGPLARPVFFDTKRVPVLPVPRGLRFQAVHSGDVAAAVVAAVERPVRGAVNLAGPGLLRRQEVARLFGARTVEVPSAVIRTALATGFHSRLAPAPPELYDALMRLPELASVAPSASSDGPRGTPPRMLCPRSSPAPRCGQAATCRPCTGEAAPAGEGYLAIMTTSYGYEQDGEPPTTDDQEPDIVEAGGDEEPGSHPDPDPCEAADQAGTDSRPG